MHRGSRMTIDPRIPTKWEGGGAGNAVVYFRQGYHTGAPVAVTANFWRVRI